MSPRLRKFGLTAHISLSVGWLGTVAVFLALGIINVVLLIYMQTLTTLANMAADPTMDLQALWDGSPVDHAVLALLVIATGLAVYKPRAMTRYGWRKQQGQRAATQREQRPQVPAA